VIELESEFEKKSGSGGLKTGLIVCAVLVVILAISSLWLYTGYDSLQNQVDTLTSDKIELQSQVDSLEESQLHMLDDGYIDLFPEPYVNCYGTVFNSGTKTAYNVVTTWKVYDAYDTLLATREIPLGHVEGKSSETFDIDVACQNSPGLVTYEITWDLTP
jgi:hypothetical protein